MLEKAEEEGTLEEYDCDASVFEEITQLFNEKEFYMSGKKWVAKEKSSLLLELARKREAKDGISHFDETFDKIAGKFFGLFRIGRIGRKVDKSGKILLFGEKSTDECLKMLKKLK